MESEIISDVALLANVRRLAKLIGAGGLSAPVRNDLAWYGLMVRGREADLNMIFSANNSNGRTEIIGHKRDRDDLMDDDRRKEAAWIGLRMAIEAAEKSESVESAIVVAPRIIAATESVEEALGING